MIAKSFLNKHTQAFENVKPGAFLLPIIIQISQFYW
jgi:hypothetical protein